MPVQQRLTLVQQSMMRQAKTEAQGLLRQAEEQKKQALERYEETLLEQMFSHVQRQAADLRADTAERVASEQVRSYHSLLRHREELRAQVLQEVERRIVAFAQGADYAAWLRRELVLPGEDCTVLARPQDLALLRQLLRGSPHAQLLEDPSIRLGGFVLLLEGGRLRIDHTLDARLEEQAQWFLEHSGLQVRE